MVYSEVPNFSEPNPELLAQANQQNKSVSSHAPIPDIPLPWQPLCAFASLQTFKIKNFRGREKKKVRHVLLG